MKRTFPLKATGQDDARVRDKIRHELNKYVHREQKKKLPEGFDRWIITCQIGLSAMQAESLPLKEVGRAIDKVALSGATDVYVEIVAVAGHRAFTRAV